MIEKRLSERFANEFPLTFSNSTEEYRGVSMDFSIVGLFILTDDPFSPGTRVKISLEVSKHKTIRLVGVVIRTMKTGDIKDGMAIKLDAAPFIYHQFLESIVKTF